MALRRFELVPLAAALYVSPYRLDDLAQLRTQCTADLPGVAAELTVLLVTVCRDAPEMATTRSVEITGDTIDQARIDACITTAATVVDAVNQTEETASGTGARP
ncbi:hypothetical protein JOF56_001931 [Kibdelosporangium banguiense]|uniref:Uncharacterized protein n=1 Tax=Kibdelosporangium banguiense TaxID=1365924 RepID=A0ABS4TB17_9PSEU|nr:hypothetical protein [Kibdelosporangium banguiense]MBP2321546.1 hypothetical protein [Kibdelosporangium banguiense]